MHRKIEALKKTLIDTHPEDDLRVEEHGKLLESEYEHMDKIRKEEAERQEQLRKQDARYTVYHHPESRDKHHIEPWEAGVLTNNGYRRY